MGVASAQDPVYQQSTQFHVKGLIKPTACKLIFEGGDTWDYGIIASSEIDAESGGEKFIRREGDTRKITIQCDSDTSVRVKFVDAFSENKGSKGAFGLNKTSNDKKFGIHYFSLQGAPVLTDSSGAVDGAVFGRSENQDNWHKVGFNHDWVWADNFYTPITQEGVPVPFTSLTTAIKSVVALNKGLGLVEEEEFRGTVTMELWY
ncbi:hypothetical protein [Chromobacterium haemolyticum]|uniref:hypothetical protein n=1 Tax=Chromobacterium haemolyticum TaxID=394935 RepID=UPI002952B948|nr:hypothetical protein [Chromobacterium haemolyticum]WON84964.1 hypothetical protein OK026_05485 [Chromobacterium haemolyticum]